jgi:hypothetical protein
LELVAHKAPQDRAVNVWKKRSILIEHAMRGFYSSAMPSEEGYEHTASSQYDEFSEPQAA